MATNTTDIVTVLIVYDNGELIGTGWILNQQIWREKPSIADFDGKELAEGMYQLEVTGQYLCVVNRTKQ